ncbi:hypothetical protein NBRC10513_005064 [Rhodotorula toruloides]
MAAADSTPSSAAVLAQQQLVLLRVHSAVLSLLLSAVFYGIALSLAVCYFRRSAGQRGEPLFVRAYIWTTLAGGTACLAIQATVLYQDLTTLITTDAMSSPRLTVPQTLEAWVGAMFAVEVKVYYVYRAVRVTKHRSFQALAILLGLGTICGFLGRAIIAVRIRLDAAIPPRQAVAWTLPSAWVRRASPSESKQAYLDMMQAFAADGLLCALILVYELVYKRRAAVVTSSLVQQFTTVAVRSSVALLPLLYSMAVIMTVGFVTQKQVYIQTGLAMSRIFPFVSCCIVFTCLLERPSLGQRPLGTTTSDTLGTRTSAAKQSVQRPSFEQRPSQQLYNVAILSPEHPAHRDDAGEQEDSGGHDALHNEEFGKSRTQASPLTGPGASARVSRGARDERKSSDATKDEDEGGQISLRAFLAQSLV